MVYKFMKNRENIKILINNNQNKKKKKNKYYLEINFYIKINGII